MHNGTTLVVKTVDTSTRFAKVFNFSVAQNANYFVGEDGVLAHNADCTFTKKMLSESRVIAKHDNIGKIQELVDKFGGRAKDWVKKKGWDERGQEWHWYENKGRRVGVKRAGQHDPF